jgi:hypothetical protein
VEVTNRLLPVRRRELEVPILDGVDADEDCVRVEEQAVENLMGQSLLYEQSTGSDNLRQ